MNEWLLLLLLPLGAAGFAELFQQEDDDREEEREPEPQGTAGDDVLAVEDRNGLVDAGDGDDTLTATRDAPGAMDVDRYDFNAFWRENIHKDGSADWDWHSDDAYPEGRSDLGVTALRGGAGDDSIAASGPSIDIDGGSGNDSISLHSDYAPGGLSTSHTYGVVRGGEGDDRIALEGWHLAADGGSGNDSLTVTGDALYGRGGAGDDRMGGSGSAIRLDGDAGSDTISLSGDGHEINGGEGDDSLVLTGSDGVAYGGDGADLIRVSGSGMVVWGGDAGGASDGAADRLDIGGLTDSEVWLDGDDVLVNHGDGNTGMTFYLSGGHGFQGSGAAETVVLRGGAVVDGGAGADTIRVYPFSGDSSTLAGGAGDDSLNGAGLTGETNGGGEDGYYLRVGQSDDVLDGGTGDDLIRFDNDDTVTGGTGADQLIGFADSDHHAVVSDFTAGEDRLHVFLDPEDVMANNPWGPDDFGAVSVNEVNGDTVISLNGAEAVTLQGAVGLNVGLCHDAADGTRSFTDLAGNPVDPATLDVRIDIYGRS